MKELLTSVLLGAAIGAIITAAYYDGVVAQECKNKVLKASEALIRADIQIKQQSKDIDALVIYIDGLQKERKNSFVVPISN